MVQSQDATNVLKLQKSAALYQNLATELAPQLPLFFQPWWLDTLLGMHQWLPFAHDNGMIWPVLLKKKGPLCYLTQPPFIMGNAWFPSENTIQLPDIPFLMKQFPTSLYWQITASSAQAKHLEQAGFTTRPAYTYQIDRKEDPAQLWRNMNELSRRNISKAGKSLQCQVSADAGILHALSERSLRRHKLPMRYTAAQLQTLLDACIAHNQGAVYTAVDQDGAIHAASFFVWDQRSCYFLLGGLDDRLPQLGASRFLLWQGIQMALKRGLHFDFHGGMTPSVGQVYASMGGQKTNYCRVERYRSPFLKIAVRTAKEIYAPNDRLFH
ncbi:MAG: GNAT family N-acetyltransferase [Saprospiraceae bacterium]